MDAVKINSIHFTFDPSDAEFAASALRELRDASREEPGVMQYDVGRSSENPNIFALWEVYRNQEALDAHFASEHFQRIFANGLRSLVKDRDVQRVVPI